MRRRRRTKGDIIVDFTALLDVIFIVLMLVLAKQQVFEKQSKESLDQKKAEADNMMEQAEKEYALYADQVETSETIKDYICLVTVHCYYDKNEITSRTIDILDYDGISDEPIVLKGNHVEPEMDELKRRLTDTIEDNPDKAVILSLNKNDDNILYRDEQSILKIFNSLNEHKNVVLK